MKFILLFTLLVFNFTESHSEIEKTRFFNLGGGWAYSGLRDKGISPLYYSGNNAIISVGQSVRSDIMFRNLEINFYVGKLFPGINPDLTLAQMKNMKTGINYSYMKFISNIINERGKLFLGGALETQAAYYEHNQFTNSSFNGYLFSTLNISGSLSYPLINKDRQYLIIFQMQLPVMAAIVRPSYAYIKPQGFMDHSNNNIQRFIKSIEISSVNKFHGISSNISIEYKFNNNDNAFRIGYKWEYIGHQNINMLKSAVHGITVQTMFNL